MIYFNPNLIPFVGRVGVHCVTACNNHQFTAPLAAACPKDHDHIGLHGNGNVYRWSAGGDLCGSTEILIPTGSGQSGQVLQWW